MTNWNVSRVVARAVWTVVGLCLPIVLHAAPTGEVMKFVSSGEAAYLEVRVDGSLHRIYTEEHAGSRAMLVFGERNNPELFELSFGDDPKTSTTSIIEYRTEKGRASPGLQAADPELIRSLRSDSDGFEEWQDRFSSPSAGTATRGVLTDAAFGDPTGITIVDGDKIVFRMSDFFCVCDRYGAAVTTCKDPFVKCAYEHLCAAFQCIEGGGGEACRGDIEDARECISQMSAE